MKCIEKTSKELSLDEMNRLFDLFIANMDEFIKTNSLYKGTDKPEFRNDWIKDILEDENGRVYQYYSDDDKFVGFIVASIRENENFIKEFHIEPEFQGNGKTFYEMTARVVLTIHNNNDFTGFIWGNNQHSRDVFRHLGAKFDGDVFRVSRDVLMNYFKK